MWRTRHSIVQAGHMLMLWEELLPHRTISRDDHFLTLLNGLPYSLGLDLASP